MDRHRIDADPDRDPDPTFCFDADPDMDPSGSYPQVLHMLENQKNIDFYSQQCQSLVYTFKYVGQHI
jgi:hypothetical protein